LDDVPKLQIFCQLGGRANRDDGADPIVVAQLFGNCAIFPGGNLEEVSRPNRKGALSTPVVVPEGG
jgi:hypothetical protein